MISFSFLSQVHTTNTGLVWVKTNTQDVIFCQYILDYQTVKLSGFLNPGAIYPLLTQLEQEGSITRE